MVPASQGADTVREKLTQTLLRPNGGVSQGLSGEHSAAGADLRGAGACIRTLHNPWGTRDFGSGKQEQAQGSSLAHVGDGFQILDSQPMEEVRADVRGAGSGSVVEEVRSSTARLVWGGSRRVSTVRAIDQSSSRNRGQDEFTYSNHGRPMSDTFSQFDHDLTDTIRFEANQEPRIDRRAIIYAGFSVFETLDRLTPKMKDLHVGGRRCRINELLTTWKELSKACRWTESSTALRDVVSRFGAPCYLQLPWAPDGRFKGIRILRMHHAGRGVIAGAYDERKPSRSGRILCGMWITLERIFDLKAEKGAERLKEMERLVDRLLEPRPVPEDGPAGWDSDSEPPPPFCSGCGETYNGVGDPARFGPPELAERLLSWSGRSSTDGTKAHTGLAVG